jgi:hypothetical protein
MLGKQTGQASYYQRHKSLSMSVPLEALSGSSHHHSIQGADKLAALSNDEE